MSEERYRNARDSFDNCIAYCAVMYLMIAGKHWIAFAVMVTLFFAIRIIISVIAKAKGE